MSCLTPLNLSYRCLATWWKTLSCNRLVAGAGSASESNVTCANLADCTARHNDLQELELKGGETILAKLVIGADGANSQVRQMAGIGVHAWQYAQSCMLISVQCENDPGDSTWQQFTPDGPRAFLPLFDNWASLVWYDSPARIRQLQNMNMAQLQAEIAKHFPSQFWVT